MPRSSKINSKPSTPAPRPSPAPYVQSSTPAPPSMFDTIKQGFSFGVGSSIAHNIFDSKSKNEHVNTNTNETKLTADKIYDLYNKCLDNNNNNNNNIDCNMIFENMNNK